MTEITIHQPKTHWKGRDNGGFQAEVVGLGLVEIYHSNTNQGRVVFINGKQHSGGWRYDLDNIRSHMDAEIRQWHYLNQFRV